MTFLYKKIMVTVKLLGDKVENEEYEGGVYIQNMLIDYFKNRTNIDGIILIKPNFRAPGEKREDIDIVVWMRFKNFREKFYTKYQNNNSHSEDKSLMPVYLNSFLLAIEVKSHNRDGVVFTSTEVKVKYNDKLSSATAQNEEQSYSLLNFIRKNALELKHSPYINRLIWLRSFDSTNRVPFGCNVINVLFGNFSFNTLIETVFNQNPPYKSKKGSLSYTAYHNRDSELNLDFAIENILLHYEKHYYAKQGTLTRRKLEQLVQRELNESNKKRIDQIGQRTLIIQGVPGSGKTINLLHLAYHMAKQKAKRCLILTYNIALNADIDRLSLLAGFKNDPSSATVGTNTCMRLMRKFFIAWGIYNEEPANLSDSERERYIQRNFFEKYEDHLNELRNYLDNEVLNNKEIEETKQKIEELNWDVVFIDESQDWYPQERDILYKLYGAKNFVIAYGSHQLVRQTQHTDWTISTEVAKPVNLNISFRQKINLCLFINEFNNKIEFNRHIDINQKLVGGSVLIFTRPFNSNDYKIEYKYCVEECKNAGYDILILVNNKDKLIDELKQNDIKFHNGTLDKNKGKYPSDVESSRLYNYKSCRGLEGWTVIANNLDLFIEKEMNLITKAKSGLSLQETREEHAANWLYMIFSRAIDRLIIILHNPNTEYSKHILAAANNKDYVHIYRQFD